jgi:hypothetical protein
MPRLPNLHLYRVCVDDQPLQLVVKGRSQAAVRDHVIERHIRIERLSPDEAFQAGVSGAIIETAGTGEDAPQDTPSTSVDAAEPGLFDSTSPLTRTANSEDASARPSEGPGPGYAAAMNEAATL